ncbi:MAG TPA: hypothetical protein VFC63_29185 [Blastocatellia bacterium]|nr:hypothetical protein [Blastocatellia bacterium]
MSPVAKVVIGIVVSVVLIVIVCVALAAYWFVSHKDQLSKQFVEGPQKAMDEGKKYGRTTDNDGCVDKAFEKEKEDNSFGSAISNGVFLRSCLDNSKSTPNFCASVPKPTSILDSSTWLKQQCQKRAPGDQYCTQLFQQVQQFCYVGH